MRSELYQGIRGLLNDLTEAGRLLDHSPHWRIQNQMAHAGLAMLATKLLLAAGLPILVALIAVIVLGAAWEFIRRSAPDRSQVLKSIGDVHFYSCGALFVCAENQKALALLGLYICTSLVIWSLLPKILVSQKLLGRKI